MEHPIANLQTNFLPLHWISMRAPRVSIVPRSAPAVILAVGLLFTACNRGDAKTSAGAQPVTTAIRSPWLEIARTSGVVGYLDTTRVQHDSGGSALIWFRFVYTTPMTVGADTSVQYAASEMHEQLDCAKHRTKDLVLKLERTTGADTTTSFKDPQWTSIDTHPLGAAVFVVACRTLGTPIPGLRDQ